LKVSREVIERWCDMLENEGLIVTKETLKEKYAMTKEFYRNKNNTVYNILKSLKTIATKHKSYDQKIIE
jgi:hypothetical protein